MRNITIAVLVALAGTSGFAIGLNNAPPASIALKSGAILSGVIIRNVPILIFEASNVQISESDIGYSAPWINDWGYGIYIVGGSDSTIRNNVISMEEPWLDKAKRAFFSQSEVPCIVINDEKFKDCKTNILVDGMGNTSVMP